MAVWPLRAGPGGGIVDCRQPYSCCFTSFNDLLLFCIRASWTCYLVWTECFDLRVW